MLLSAFFYVNVSGTWLVGDFLGIYSLQPVVYVVIREEMKGMFGVSSMND